MFKPIPWFIASMFSPQDEFRKEMDSLFRHIPVVLDDDDAQEKQRDEAMAKARDAIARRWIALKTIGSTWHKGDLDELVENTKVMISDLITIHGPDIPICSRP